MATYKVLQDIEAEDKLLGPLTLKQFIFAIVTIGIGFVEFRLITASSLSVLRWPFVIALLPPLLIFGFLAAPISRDQPNDVWLLARLRYILKPHKRIWNQDGLSQLVTITAPRRVQQMLTNGLNQSEVKSRLQALASTLDSRGWAVKNVDVNMFGEPGYLSASDDSDRLVAPSALPISESPSDVQAADDIMDARNNPTAQHLDQMVQASTAAHQQQVRNSVQQRTSPNPAAAAGDYWFMNQPASPPAAAPQGYATFQSSQVVAPGSDDADSATQPTAEEKALIAKIEADKAKEETSGFHSHLKTIQPLGSRQPLITSRQPIGTGQTGSSFMPSLPLPGQNNLTSMPAPTGTSTPNPAILNLANNDDLNVATIARQAQRISESDGEVIIPLH
jgi:hypothetical protein